MTTRLLIFLTDDTSSILVRGQLKFLINKDFDVHVGVCQSSRLEVNKFDDGVVVHPIDFVRQPSPLRDLRSLIQAIRLIHNLRPDVVHASTPKAGLLGMIAARMCRIPIRAYQVRGLRYESETGLARWLYRGAERLAMTCATEVLFNSESLRALAEQDALVDEHRGIVLGSGNGVDCDHFSPARSGERTNNLRSLGIPDDACVIGFVGRMTRDKGISDLVEVFDSIAAISTWLLLVGPFEDGDALSSDLRTRIRRHPRIVHRDWIDDPRVAFTSIDVLAFPSYREGLPNAVLEAQACAVPVVGYAATGTIDAVIDTETGFLVPVGDRKALENSLRVTLEDHQLRQRLGIRAREYVITSFQQRDVWERIAAVYRSTPRV